MKNTKHKYRIEAFCWVLGERVTKRRAYTHAYSKAQAVRNVFGRERIPDSWEISVEVLT